jgi:methylenetetrahydrofolate dehydrogenase (NAD+)
MPQTAGVGRVSLDSVADRFNTEISVAVARSVFEQGLARPRLVGIIANEDTEGEVYARMTKRACEKNGIAFELRRLDRVVLEAGVIEANEDANVHGIIIYYPVFGGQIDEYLRDVVSIEKDVEGLNHRYRYALYHNIRTLGGVAGRAVTAGKKCIAPCTPLAVIKILESLDAYDRSKPVGRQLTGQTAVVFNRSEVVGRPLAAMLANDGARVFSVDEHGMLLYSAGAVDGTIKVEETTATQQEALRDAAIVVSGVPSKAFQIQADSIRAGAIAVNFSQHQNFGPGIEERCIFVPAIGKVSFDQSPPWSP